MLARVILTVTGRREVAPEAHPFVDGVVKFEIKGPAKRKFVSVFPA